MNEDLIVIKVGGSCLRSDRENVAEQIVTLAGQRPFMLIHGYGPELRELLSTLGVERPTFVSASGMPSHETTEEVAELSALAACRVRKKLAEQFEEAGVATKAIPAYENSFVGGVRKKGVRYVQDGVVRVRHGDFAGKVTRVSVERFAELRQTYRCFIVSAILRGHEQETLVIDADRLAIEIALALNASSLYILSDQPGLLLNGATVPCARLGDIARLEPHATGGMSRKLRHIKTGLQAGIGNIFLLDGTTPFLNGAPHGTVFSPS